MAAPPPNVPTVITFGAPKTLVKRPQNARPQGPQAPPGTTPLRPIDIPQVLAPPVGVPMACTLDRVAAAATPDMEVHVTQKEVQAILRRTAEREEALPTLEITKSLISIFSFEEMQAYSGNLRVTSDKLEGHSSVNDPRMGSVTKSNRCLTCPQIDCPGHYGLIEFKVPIYNPLFIRDIIRVLTCVCNDCGGLLLTRETLETKGLLRLSGSARLDALEGECKKLICSRKHEAQPGGRIIKCRKNPIYIPARINDTNQIVYHNAKAGRGEIEDDKENIKPIVDVERILNQISMEDAELMGFSNGSHPKRMIMRGILVIPPIARPPVFDGGAMLPDQLTTAYVQIVKVNNSFDHPRTDKTQAAADLYLSVKHLIDNSDGKYHTHGREFMSVRDRLQGKEAVLRGMSMGKRGNFCGRTPIGPDPSLKFGQVRVPEVMAPVLTKPVRVTQQNRKFLLKLLAQNKITHITSSSGRYKGHRRQVFPGQDYNLRAGDANGPGDLVERWLMQGDRVVINRAPTLHKQSLMAFEVVLGKPLTIGLHLSYSSPFNAD